MRDHATKHRLIVISGLTTLALPLVIFSVPWTHTTLEASLNLRPWAHVTLEASLNLVWFLLAVGAFAYWTSRGGGKCHTQLPELASLIFVLSLLFPVISANDDWAEQYLINDASTAQSLVTSLKNEKRALISTGVPSPPVPLAAQCIPLLPLTFELTWEAAFAAGDAPAIHATGNHSPPLC